MKVAFIGNLGNFSYTTAKYLRKYGLDAHVFVLPGEVESIHSNPLHEDAFPNDVPPPWIHLWSGKSSLLRDYRFFKGFDIIEAGTVLPLVLQFLVSDYVAYAHGSDLKEFASRSSLTGYLQRRAYRKARLIRFGDVTMLRWMEKFGLTRWQFVPCIMDVDKYSSHPALSGEASDGLPLSILHPSRLDWTDTSGERLSIKRNDILIKAFARFVKDGHDAKLTLVDWGVDRRETGGLIQHLDIENHVTIVPKMKKSDLIRLYANADVVADQFFIGSPGLVGFEGMSSGKPVLSYLDVECAKFCYEGDIPPVVNVKTEEDVYRQLSELRDQSRRDSVGSDARQWMLKHHHGDVVARRLLDIYRKL
ncbi:MAG: glycosyltransferase family 4 protein [Candidatus Zixiibacteriota bacterium]